MQAIQWVISTCMSISWLFYDAYLEVYSAWYVPNIIGDIFLWVSDRFVDLAHYFSSFSAWVDYATDWIAKILSWDYILSLIMPYLQWGINAWDWVKGAWGNVWNEIEEWWNYAQTTVKGWITIATQGFNTLKTEWDNFWKMTLPNLLDWFKLENWWSTKLLGIDGLIDSTLKRWFPWYETLVAIKDEIFEFFADPLEWVYKKLDEFFERFW